jgi:L-ascorbate metabolism protein UlaG (beta-lactamase superfamily)
MARIRLRPDVALWVANRDTTFFGSPVGTRPDEATRRLFGRVLRHAEQHGVGDLAATSPTTLALDVADDAFADVAERDRRGGWRVRSEVLYPDAALAGPHTLHVTRPDRRTGVQVRLPAPLWPHVHDVIAALSEHGHEEASRVGAEIGELLAALRNEGLVESADDADTRSPVSELPEITFAGHNTVVVRSKTTGVLVDPFLRARRTTYPASYQPLTRAQLGPIDAIMLTHSHPDHFDPGSLLRFGREVHVIVPSLERETVLSVDLAGRLRQLGFDRVTALGWGERLRVGDIEIAALPFRGEQPAEHDVLHPEVRNAGNTYVVRTPTTSCAFVADSGRDPSGDVKDVARRWAGREGPIDIVFSGYRGWQLYPFQLLFSSVSRFLLFVPPALWGTRQQLMNSVDDAIDVAESFGARYLVPYADGGAPWYWDLGLGPRLDGRGLENTTFDPFPERVVEAATRRGQTPTGSTIASPVEVVLLRPGESLSRTNDDFRVARTPGHEWPYVSEPRMDAT